jgi:hypothetical protein
MSPVRSSRQSSTLRRGVRRFGGLAVAAMGVAMLLPATSASAATTAPGLATAGSFAVLAGSAISNTGPTTITGDVGSFPTNTLTGFNDVTLHGARPGADVVNQAKTDLGNAFVQARESGPPAQVGTELASLVPVLPGVYHSNHFGITGTMTLNTLGNPNAVFIFQSDFELTTATDSRVEVLNGSVACNVFWEIGSSATLGVRSHMVGTVMAGASITATTSATIEGRLLAGTGAVTLDTNTITRPDCDAGGTTTTTPTPTTSPTTTPTPTSVVTTAPPTSNSQVGPTAVAPTTAVNTRTPGGAASPQLPRTGSNPLLPITGAIFVGVGVVLVRVSGSRSRRPAVR